MATPKRRLRHHFNTPPRELLESHLQLHTPQRSAIIGVLYYCEQKSIPCSLQDIQNVFGIPKSTASDVVASGRCRRLKNSEAHRAPPVNSITHGSRRPETTAPQTQSGSEVAEKTKIRRRLNTPERELAISKLQAGCKAREVADLLGVSDRSIRNLYQKFKATGLTQDLPRSGRPGLLSVRQKRMLHREYRKDPNTTYPELRAMVHEPDGTATQPPSKATVYRALKETGVTPPRG